jgi:KDO2-lipid IV(A) lauroyltransferase
MGIINRIVYYGFILPISLLPFPLLYLLSDFLAFIMYYVIGYRKKVVFQNLKNSFPERSKEERTRIAKKFYRHFCDVTLESLKMFTISSDDAHKHIEYLDVDIPKKYFDQGKSIIVAMAHYNNWEMVAVTVAQSTKHDVYAIYKPLTSKYFDKKVIDSRQKYGLTMLHNRTVKEDFEKLKNKLTATYFLIDQAPSMHSKPYWTTFLNQETGVLMGSEKYAKDYDFPVVFLDIQKPRRGFYSCRYIDVTGSPRSFAEGELTEKLTRLLEGIIQAKPEFWLWSHRRWKRTRENSNQYIKR